MDTALSSIDKPKAKPGPKPKAKIDVEELEIRVHNLEQLVLRMAHNSGTSRGIIGQAGLTPWEPTKADMTKHFK